MNTTELAVEIAAAIRAITPIAPIEHTWWNAEETGRYLGVSARQVSERLALRADFPKAKLLPSEPGRERKLKRWKATEVIGWMKRQ